jgi:hypothetical protein
VNRRTQLKENVSPTDAQQANLREIRDLTQSVGQSPKNCNEAIADFVTAGETAGHATVKGLSLQRHKINDS